jgi:hypothetical protein
VPPRDWLYRLEDIVDAAESIESYVRDMTFEAFCSDSFHGHPPFRPAWVGSECHLASDAPAFPHPFSAFCKCFPPRRECSTKAGEAQPANSMQPWSERAARTAARLLSLHRLEAPRVLSRTRSNRRSAPRGLCRLVYMPFARAPRRRSR